MDYPQEEITKALKMMNDATLAGGNFLLEQAPMVAQELVAYQFWSAIAYIGLALLFLFFVSRVLWPLSIRVFNDDAENGTILRVPIVIAAIIACLVFAGNLQCAIKAQVAPRLVILDYVKGMVVK